jgi:hypothetical protein
MENECANCKKDLNFETYYFMCCVTMNSYCVDCWKSQPCDKEHSEDCATKVWN